MGSVAAYSLGDPHLLACATAEVVRVMDGWGVLGGGRDALDVGCGIARVAVAIAGRVHSVHGIDISPRMIAAARRRAAGIANVSFDQCTGRNLAPVDAAQFDLVYAADSFPYVQRIGAELVEHLVADIARVLAPGGDFVVFNYSYRDDLDADRRDLVALADAHGFEVVVNDAYPFTLWDAAAFRLRRITRS